MNLERHLRVLWRYKIVVAVGCIIAIALAVFASFQMGSGGLQRRGTETWSSTSQVLVTQKGFPWGRVTLPAATTQAAGGTGTPAATNDGTDGQDHIQYADPNRFVNLALLYSVISYSDQVRNKLPGHPRADQIQAMLLDPTNSGQSYLPIISLTTSATTPDAAVKLNNAVFGGLRDELSGQQKAANIKDSERVLLSQLSKPAKPALVQGYSMTSSLLAFILCIVSTLALVHILEGLRMAKLRRNGTILSEDRHVAHGPIPQGGGFGSAPEVDGHGAAPLVPTGGGLHTPPPPPAPQTWR
jgi:hypothetical protein